MPRSTLRIVFPENVTCREGTVDWAYGIAVMSEGLDEYMVLLWVRLFLG